MELPDINESELRIANSMVEDALQNYDGEYHSIFPPYGMDTGKTQTHIRENITQIFTPEGVERLKSALRNNEDFDEALTEYGIDVEAYIDNNFNSYFSPISNTYSDIYRMKEIIKGWDEVMLKEAVNIGLLTDNWELRIQRKNPNRTEYYGEQYGDYRALMLKWNNLPDPPFLITSDLPRSLSMSGIDLMVRWKNGDTWFVTESDADNIRKDMWLEIDLFEKQRRGNSASGLRKRKPGQRVSREVYDVLEDYHEMLFDDSIYTEEDGYWANTLQGNRVIGPFGCQDGENCEGYCVWCETADTPIQDVFMWDAPGWLKSHYGTNKTTGEVAGVYLEEDPQGYRGKRFDTRRKSASLFDTRKRLKGKANRQVNMQRNCGCGQNPCKTYNKRTGMHRGASDIRFIENNLWRMWNQYPSARTVTNGKSEAWMSKGKAQSVANNIRTKKAGGGVHQARVVGPFSNGRYVVYEKPKKVNLTKAQYRTQMARNMRRR